MESRIGSPSREVALVQQLVAQVMVTPISNEVCTPWHLVLLGTDMCFLISNISPCGKGEVGKD
jgi:hypothetical protein